MKRTSVVLFTAAALVFAAMAYANHSFAATYFEDQTQTVEGKQVNPADHRARMRSISRPSDGWKWSGGVQ